MDREFFSSYLQKHKNTIDWVHSHLFNEISTVAQKIFSSLKNGGKVLIMGNGGSAADAQHFGAEVVGRFLLERKALPAIALSTDTSILTAVGNDYGFEQVFSRQVEALARRGDVVVGLSTSGHSKNVLEAIIKAKQIGCSTIGLLGRDGGLIGQAVDLKVIVKVEETPFIQEAHMTIIHMICDTVEKKIFES